MEIDIEAGGGQAEEEGRRTLDYMFEGPEDKRENVVDNLVWLDLEIT